MVYQFREGSRLRGDAAAVAEHILRTAKVDALEMVTPEAIVNDARDPDSILHSYFEWDDGAAAEAYRHEQARHLTRSIQVFITDDGQPMKAFHQVEIKTENDDDDKEHWRRGYVDVNRASQDAELRRQVVRGLYGRARSFIREARAFEEFGGLVEAFEALPPLHELERAVASA